MNHSKATLFRNIQSHITINAADKAYVQAHVRTQQVAKKERLLTQGQLCQKLYFVASGRLRAFHLNEDAKDG